MLNTKDIRKQFPIFEKNPDLIYLDSTATSLKPRSVLEKITEYYSEYSANIFRGVYKISEKATEEYEQTREIVADFINASKTEEIIFTRNATESLNLIAYALGRKIIEKNDEIVTTIMEHHSNFVPWQVLAQETGAIFKVIDIDENGYLSISHPDTERAERVEVEGSSDRRSRNASLDSSSSTSSLPQNDKINLEQVITRKTKILTLTYVSNVLGTINPVKEIIKVAKTINPKIITIVDAAQAVPHMRIDVNDLGSDFIVFSSHKMLGPTGVGVLWGKEELLNDMFPFMYGGEMINEVHVDRTVFRRSPHKFEAGTPSIGEVIAFKEAIRFLNSLGMDKIRESEKNIAFQCFKTLKSEFKDKIKILGPSDPKDRSGVLAFTFNNFHPHDIASILDEENIAVRAGHHCAMPLHERLEVEASVRASFYIYNDESDINNLVRGLKKAVKILGKH